MSRLARLARLVALAGLAACQPGTGGTDGNSTGQASTTSSTSTTGSNSASSGGVTPTTGGGTAGATGSETGVPSTSTTGANTSTSTSASTSTSTTTDPATTDPATTDPSTGGALDCVDVTADYGPCEAELGYGFDGTSCRLFSGCDCAPNCEHIKQDPVACASACAAAGHCQEDKIEGAALAMDPVGVGSFCDELDACADPGSEQFTWLEALFPGLLCEGAFPCEQGQSCHLQFAGMIDARQWTQLCAASLLPGAELYCVVFGP